MAAVAVALGVGAWWMLGSSSNGESAAQPSAASGAAASQAAMAEVNGSVPAGDDASAVDTDTAALNQAMSGQPDGQQQLNRVLNFVKFQRDFERWQTLQGEGDPSVRQALGQKLLSQLPEHIAKASLTLPEGEFMCGMIYSDQESNEATRDAKISECQEKLRSVAPKTDSPQAMKQVDCESDYRAREAALVAAFQALPSAQRDPARLQGDLDKAHREVYNDPQCRP